MSVILYGFKTWRFWNDVFNMSYMMVEARRVSSNTFVVECCRMVTLMANTVAKNILMVMV